MKWYALNNFVVILYRAMANQSDKTRMVSYDMSRETACMIISSTAQQVVQNLHLPERRLPDFASLPKCVLKENGIGYAARSGSETRSSAIFKFSLFS